MEAFSKDQEYLLHQPIKLEQANPLVLSCGGGSAESRVSCRHQVKLSNGLNARVTSLTPSTFSIDCNPPGRHSTQHPTLPSYIHIHIYLVFVHVREGLA